MGADLNLDYKGKAVTNMVVRPVDDVVIGVQVKSKPWILPRVETPAGPPNIPRCSDRHIIRTEHHVVVVEVKTKVIVHPRYVTMDQLRQCGREAIAEHAPQAEALSGYEVSIEAFARRLARKLRRRGVTVR
jgi:hypothetical protein